MSAPFSMSVIWLGGLPYANVNSDVSRAECVLLENNCQRFLYHRYKTTIIYSKQAGTELKLAFILARNFSFSVLDLLYLSFA